jgi:DNA methylase
VSALAGAGALTDAELQRAKTLPGYPDGEDEAVRSLSRPIEFTACPNPYVRGWLEASEPPERLPYSDPGPFAADVSQGKGQLIYRAHSYPTKVPHPAIMRFILHYTNPGDVVLDGFAGSGMTGLAAQACGAPDAKLRREIEADMGPVRWGARRAVLQDLAPSAGFIAAGVNLPVDADAFAKRSRQILEEFDEEWGWLYETVHQDSEIGRIDYTVWSQVFTCRHCGGEVVFYEAAFDPAENAVLDEFACPKCGARVSRELLDARRSKVRTLGGDTIERIELRPVAIHYRLGAQAYAKRPDEADLSLLRRLHTARLPWFPTDPLPLEQMYHGSRLGPKGIASVHHLWSDRALAALAVMWAKASQEGDADLRAALRFWVDQAFWGLSWMNRYRPKGYSQVSQYQNGVYYIPALHSECSIRYNLEGSSPARGRRGTLIKIWSQSPARRGQVAISTGSSTHLPLEDDSIDYVFVDPPFGANFPYADLALVVESWHRVRTAVREEAILDAFRLKGMPEYQALMERCFREFFRVLRPGRWMTVEFSNSSNEVWLAIQQALASAGFVVADSRVFDKEHLSYRQVTAKNAVKRDIIVSSYKPAETLEREFELVKGLPEGAWAFVREHLSHVARLEEESDRSARSVRERQPDRLYDRMVAYHVARGVSVPFATAAEFYAGLDERFPRRDGMYFLPAQAAEYERRRLTLEQLEQAELFITSESSAVQWLRRHLTERARQFHEIQPLFFRELQTGMSEWDSLPDLKQLLEENFLQDEHERWYVPDPARGADLEKLRTRALLREFEQYKSGRSKLARFRFEAIRAGFKHAWSQKDYELIVRVGTRMPADAFAEDAALLHYFNNAQRLLR